MPKPLDGEILPPEHEYNKEDLDDLEWLRAVRNDKSLPMSIRMEASKAALNFRFPRLQQVAQDVTSGLTIHISGGLPDLPGTNIIMPETDKPKSNGKGPNGKDPTSPTEK